MRITIIGIDCAVQPANVGLAQGTLSGDRTVVEDVQVGVRPGEKIVDWPEHRKAPALLAMDAPLGWPVPMGEYLAEHRAGERLNCAAHDLFRRKTDLFVRQRLGQQSLDVGADRIARTAWSALELLHSLRDRLGQEIPLAWQPSTVSVSAIEVYPAATLKALGISATGYKQKGQTGAAARERVLSAVGDYIDVATEVPDLAETSDGVDAVVCALAGHDFLMSQALPPPNDPATKREGWIWVRPLAAAK